MSKISRDQAVAALVEAVRDALTQGDAVHIPSLGTFRVEHRPSTKEHLPDGGVVMQPPRNVIVFSPQD